MRIGIDARMIGKGYGLGRYVEQLICHLTRVDIDNEYVLFVQNQEVLDDVHIKNSKFQCIVADIPWYSWQEQIKFVPIIKQAHIDVMHFPHWNVPLAYTDPFVITFHDLTMYHYPRPEATTLGPLKFWVKDKAHRLVVKHAVKGATHIITTSDFTKRDLHKTLGVPLSHMTTIYQAPEINLETTEEVPRQYVLEQIEKKPYVLYVGAAYPHKNIDGLLKAWNIFEKKYGDTYQLVLVGKENEFWQRVVNHDTMKHVDHVQYVGFVPDDILEVVYRKAALFIFPSMYEGFGLPPLEAIARDIPVASSNRSCLPEVLGEAAVYFDPENHEQMADVMYMGLTDDDIRFALKQQGREELKRFSWERAAREIVNIYTQK